MSDMPFRVRTRIISRECIGDVLPWTSNASLLRELHQHVSTRTHWQRDWTVEFLARCIIFEGLGVFCVKWAHGMFHRLIIIDLKPRVLCEYVMYLPPQFRLW